MALLILLTSAAIAAAQSVTSTATDAAQYSSIISAKYSAYTYCSRLLLTCQPTVASCASSLCASCTTIGQTALDSCCASGIPTATSCFAAQLTNGGPNIYHSGQTESAAPTITPMTSLSPGAQACANISSDLSICESLTPGFTTETVFAYQAPCLCYTGDTTPTWAPSIYDGWISQCNSYLSISTNNTAPCAAVGDVEASYSSYIKSTTSSTAPGSASMSTATSTAPSLSMNILTYAAWLLTVILLV